MAPSAKQIEQQTIGIIENSERQTIGCFHDLFVGINKRIVHSKEEIDQLSERFGEDSWQVTAVNFIQSKRVQHTLVVLLLLDVCILFTELLLDAFYPTCHIIVRDAISCCPAGGGGDDGGGGDHRFLFEPDGRFLAAEDHCEPPLHDTDYDAACDHHKHEAVHTAHDVLFGFTIAILSIFMIELLILLFALGPSTFFRHHLYVLDLIVVIVSLALECTFFALDEDALAAFSGLLILTRCWRMVRIGHALVISTLEIEHERQEEHREYVKELERIVMELGGELPPAKKERQRGDGSKKEEEGAVVTPVEEGDNKESAVTAEEGDNKESFVVTAEEGAAANKGESAVTTEEEEADNNKQST